MKLEVLVIPVSDVARAVAFYEGLGWRKDADISGGGRRILQFTPPGSDCSIIFGDRLTDAEPGSTRLLHLVVADIIAARSELLARGASPSEVFHDAAGGYNRFDAAARAAGRDPEGRSYASFATFADPDGNEWILQEITTRFPGRVAKEGAAFSSPQDLAAALRRAADAHGAHETRTGRADPKGWPDWYSAWMVAEQTGAELPH